MNSASSSSSFSFSSSAPLASAIITEEDVQKILSGEATTGPRLFRCRVLAPLSRGLRDLRNKVVAHDDTAMFHDLALLHILAEAHSENAPERLEKRRALIASTDDVPGFRAIISLLMDDVSDQDLTEARRLTNEILGIVEKAEVLMVEKKSEPLAALAEPSPMPTPSPSGSSPGTPAGPPILSAGN